MYPENSVVGDINQKNVNISGKHAALQVILDTPELRVHILSLHVFWLKLDTTEFFHRGIPPEKYSGIGKLRANVTDGYPAGSWQIGFL